MWIETDNGWVNLDHVSQISQISRTDARYPGEPARYRLQGVDGASVAEVSIYSERLQKLLGTVIPAPAGTLAYALSFPGEQFNAAPGVFNFPVIGWWFGDGSYFPNRMCWPLLAGDLEFDGGGYHAWALKKSDGRFLRLGFGAADVYENEDRWIEAIRAEHRRCD
jgi:hypothetical protein